MSSSPSSSTPHPHVPSTQICSPPPPPESPHIDIDFIKRLHHLEEVDPNAYESRFLGSGSFVTGNVYGGLIFAQSIAAAEKTVDMEKFTTHSVQGLFILSGKWAGWAVYLVQLIRTIPAMPDKPIKYRVQRVRDGRSFSTRSVQAEQDGKIVFIAQMSLCVKDPTSIEHQLTMPAYVGDPEQFEGYFPKARELLRLHNAGGEADQLPKRVKKDLEMHLAEEYNTVFEVGGLMKCVNTQ